MTNCMNGSLWEKLMREVVLLGFSLMSGVAKGGIFWEKSKNIRRSLEN